MKNMPFNQRNKPQLTWILLDADLHNTGRGLHVLQTGFAHNQQDTHTVLLHSTRAKCHKTEVRMPWQNVDYDSQLRFKEFTKISYTTDILCRYKWLQNHNYGYTIMPN